MYCLFLHSLNPQLIQFLIENLTQVHNNRLVDLLPQMGTENLDQRDFECWNFAVQEYASQVELHLETNVDIGSVYLGKLSAVPCDFKRCSRTYRGRPPECEATIRNLIQT